MSKFRFSFVLDLTGVDQDTRKVDGQSACQRRKGLVSCLHGAVRTRGPRPAEDDAGNAGMLETDGL